MSNELAVVTPQTSAISLGELRSKKQFLKDTVCKPAKREATDNEFELFAHICAKRNLDPLVKQIYAVFRWDSQTGGDKMVVQTSIDGFRLLAQRSGQYAGQVGPHWCGDDGVWRDVWLGQTPPVAARVGVLRRDFTEPLYAVAKTDSYMQTNKDGNPQGLWRKMPEVMIAKCAESLALRRAFPEELSGLSSDDEMQQAEPIAQAPQRETPKVEAVPANDPRTLAFEAIQKWSGVSAEDMVGAVRSVAKAAGITPTKQTTPEEWSSVLAFVAANQSRPFTEAIPA